MKTIKKGLHKSKSKHSKKNLRKMTGGSLDSIIMTNTLNLMNSIVNYLQIEASRTVYYTQVKFELNSTIINNLITYGLTPSLGGNIVDTSQPYIIYFFVYYYTSKVFSEFFKTKDKGGTSNVELFLLPAEGSTDNQIQLKEVTRDLELDVDRTYCIFMNLGVITSIITLRVPGTPSPLICIRFKLVSTGIQGKNKNSYLPELIITGIYMLNTEPDNVKVQDYYREFITKLRRGNSNLTTYFTPVPYSDEVRDKLKSIILYTIDVEKQIISFQSSNTTLRFIYLNGQTHLKFNPIPVESIVIPVQMSATLLTFMNKISEALKGNLSNTGSKTQTSKLSAITENYIPNVLNVYLTTPSYSQIQLNGVLLKRDMFPPYSSSSNELQINPRYDFTKTKSSFTKQYCKLNKECYVDTLYSFSEFTKFNKQNKSGKRLQTIQQVTPNVSGNIETTLSLLLPNYTLKINGEEMVITDYNWDHQWKLLGPKENLLSLQPEYLLNKPPENTVSIQTCYKNLLEFYDDLIELFYPSMSGKEITKLYGNYLSVLNERNAMLNDIKKLVNKNTLTIKTVGLSADEKNKLVNISTKSITLNEYINKFVESILYQLIVIGNLTRKLINRIHSSCFFYFSFDSELYPTITSTPSTSEGPQAPPVLLSIVRHIVDLIGSEDTKYKGIQYIENYLSPLYYPDPSRYNDFFSSLQCGSLIVNEYTSIIQSFSNIIKTVLERLDKIAAHMMEIKDNTSYETFDLSNETLSKLWISDENIERVFSEFEKNIRSFIKYNLTETYYSKPVIERWIDDTLWDMDKSNTYTYSRLFTTFVYDNVWTQFEILFSLKVLQYIFLIYQYTGKYIYYKQVPLKGGVINNQFLSFLDDNKNINLFSCIVNWFKFNCIFQIQELIKTNGTVTLIDIQTLFATNELILGSYTLMRYYITQIILTNVDVCQLTSELETFIDILSPNESDLKNIMPQTIKEKEKEKEVDKSPDSKGKENKSNEPDTKKLSYNVQVQVKVKKMSGSNETKEKLNSGNIYEYLGCKNRDLQFQFNKLKQSAGILTGDISGFISKKTTLLKGPNISQLEENLKLSEPDNAKEASEIKSLFYNEDSTQIISSVNLSETRVIDKQDNFFVSVNKLVYAINKQTMIMKTTKSSTFSTTKIQDTTIADIIDTRIFGLYNTLYKFQD